MHNMKWEDARIIGVEEEHIKKEVQRITMYCRKGGETTFEPGLWPASPSLMDKLYQPLGNFLKFSNCITEEGLLVRKF